MTQRGEKRRCKDLWSLFSTFGFLILFLGLALYCSIYSRADTILRGFDDCGNICGVDNSDSSFDNCGIHDKRNSPKVQVITLSNETFSVRHYSCIPACPNSTVDFFNRCNVFGSQEYQTIVFGVDRIFVNLASTWHYIALVCILAFLLSFWILILFCYALHYVTWTIFVIFMISLFFGAVKTFILYKAAQYGALIVLVAILMISTLIGIVPLISVWSIFRDREALRKIPKAFSDISQYFCSIPGIFLQPLLAVFSYSLASLLFILFAILIESSGHFIPGIASDGEFQVSYKKDILVITARVLNIVIYIWFIAFIFGCQQFVISRAISLRYHTQGRSKSPLFESFKQLLTSHLGTVCLGSIVFHFVKIAKVVGDKTCLMCLKCCIPKVFSLQYLIDHAIIRAARDGTSFLEASRRVYVDFSCSHNEKAVRLKEFIDVLMTVGRQSVVVISSVAAYFLMHQDHVDLPMIPFALTLVVVFFIAHSVISLFETTVDTIFICSCSQCCVVDESDDRHGVEMVQRMSVMSDDKFSKELTDNTVELLGFAKLSMVKNNEEILTSPQFTDGPAVRVDFHAIFASL